MALRDLIAKVGEVSVECKVGKLSWERECRLGRALRAEWVLKYTCFYFKEVLEQDNYREGSSLQNTEEPNISCTLCLLKEYKIPKPIYCINEPT